MNTKAIRVFDRSRILGLNTIGFLVVALAAYFSTLVTMSYTLNRIGAVKATALVGLAVVYLVNGVYGYAWARKAESIRSSIVYIATQIGIGTALLFLHVKSRWHRGEYSTSR